MNKKLLIPGIFLLALALTACEAFLSDLGKEGQPCFNNGACYEGFVCESGVCVAVDAGIGTDAGGGIHRDGGNDVDVGEPRWDGGENADVPSAPDSGDTGTPDSGDTGPTDTGPDTGPDVGPADTDTTDTSVPDAGIVGNCGPSPTGKGGDMCDVPSGAFMMGCNIAVDNLCFQNYEKPYHTVTVPAFKMDKYEVTTGEYQDCVDNGGCTAADTGGSCNYGVSGRESHPINCVDWNQAKAYCTWAGKRLPTEAEWEKAARGTDGRKYPWGNTWDCNKAVDSVSPCSASSTASVGSKPDGISPYGALDMIGNVWEWVEDDWHDNYTGAPTDGSEWIDSPRGTYRVLRGGSWGSGSTGYFRASYRNNHDPTYRSYNYGFRCAQ